MRHYTISIREALGRVNAVEGGWFLPVKMEPDVWDVGGYEAREYCIIDLFDLLLKGDSIRLVLQEIDKGEKYQEFMGDYVHQYGGHSEIHVKEKRGNKWIVRDGEYNFHMLYSCSKYSCDENKLYFNLATDPDKIKPSFKQSGFQLIKINSFVPSHYVNMNDLLTQSDDDYENYKNDIISKCNLLSEDEIQLAKSNFDRLWHTFVDTNHKPLNVYPILLNKTLDNEMLPKLSDISC